jgi:hypothetical protein
VGCGGQPEREEVAEQDGALGAHSAAYSSAGDLNLMFGTSAISCGAVQMTCFTPGATYVQLFGLGREPGIYTPDDSKVATVDPSRATGAEAGVSYVTRTVANGTTVELTRVDTVVEGTVSVTYDDGSTFEGSFSVPRCSVLVGTDSIAVCE